MGDLDAVFKAYDVRGTVPDQLDARKCRAIGWAFARFTGADRILVARDMRETGVELSQAFSAGARSAGVGIVDIGLASTDLLYFASGSLDLPGAMFTASHNPAKYNGVKFCLSGARPVGQETGLSDVKKYAEEALSASSTGTGGIDSDASRIGPEGAARADGPDGQVRRSRTVVPSAWGDQAAVGRRRHGQRNGWAGRTAGSSTASDSDLRILYGELDGSFPNHPADPIQPENLVDLKKAVLESGADIGLAFDGDADRVFLVDEKANEVSGSLTTALVAKAMLERDPGATILYNLICSHVVPETIIEYGGTPIRTRVGHSFIKQVMAETNAVFGGEHSGHYYFRDNYRADSGIIAAMVIIGMMSTSGSTLSDLLAPFRRYVRFRGA